jgi:Fic-DOC domain mobile mystery protein B
LDNRLIFKYEPGQTPVDAAEAEALLAPVQTQAELNTWEEENILAASKWALSNRALKLAEPLSEDYLLNLHHRMFSATWAWAGKLRDRDKNIGVPFYKIRIDLRLLLDDARYWQENGTYEADELAVRFHHRLVHIHLFPNGNGRHARLVADVLIRKGGRPAFSWGGANLVGVGEARAHYLDALRAADAGDYTQLITFSRS